MAPELYVVNVMFPSLIQFSLLLVPQLHLSAFHQAPQPHHLSILTLLIFFHPVTVCCPLFELRCSSRTVVL